MSDASVPRCEKCGWVRCGCQCIEAVCPECGHWLTRENISEGVLHCPGCEQKTEMAYCAHCNLFDYAWGGYGGYCFHGACGRELRMHRKAVHERLQDFTKQEIAEALAYEVDGKGEVHPLLRVVNYRPLHGGAIRPAEVDANGDIRCPWPSGHRECPFVTLVIGFDPENSGYSYHHGFSISFEGKLPSRMLPAQWMTWEKLLQIFKDRLDLEFQPTKESLWRYARIREWRQRKEADEAKREEEKRAAAKAKRRAAKAAKEIREAGGIAARLRKMS
jgi:hypothetical protein